jgi:hypothetical protein
LTEITDRLPALSGIITKLQERTGDAPIAGLWKKDLPYGLLWQCGSRAMKRPQALSKIPTWSWVALDGPIRNHLILHSELGTMIGGKKRRSAIQAQIVIITAEVNHSGPVPTSPIMGGTISLYGRLQSATRSREDKDFRFLTELRDRDISFFCLLTPHLSTDLDIKSCHIGWCTFDQEAPSPDQLLWCLEISISERHSEESLDPFEEVPAPARAHDVFILETKEESVDTFRRIGVGVIHVGTKTFKRKRQRVNII